VVKPVEIDTKVIFADITDSKLANDCIVPVFQSFRVAMGGWRDDYELVVPANLTSGIGTKQVEQNQSFVDTAVIPGVDLQCRNVELVIVVEFNASQYGSAGP